MNGSTEQSNSNSGNAKLEQQTNRKWQRFTNSSLPLLTTIFLALLSACITTTPPTLDASPHIKNGNIAAQKSDFTGAVRHYRQALAIDPHSVTATRNLGVVLIRVGNFQEGKDQLLSAIANKDSDPETLYYLAEAYRGLGEYIEAADTYQKALRHKPNDLRLSKALAWVLLRAGSLQQSFRIASLLHRTQPNDRQVQLVFTRNLNAQKRYKETIKILSWLQRDLKIAKSTKRLGATSEEALLLTTLGEAHLGLQNCKTAILVFTQVLRRRPFLPEALTGQARCDLMQANTNRAITRLERAIKADPFSPEPHFLLAKVYQNSNASKARYYYERFLRLAKKNDALVKEVIASKAALGGLSRQ